MALRCFQRLLLPDVATQRLPLAGQLVHQRSVHPGPLVLGTAPLKHPTPAVDRDRQCCYFRAFGLTDLDWDQGGQRFRSVSARRRAARTISSSSDVRRIVSEGSRRIGANDIALFGLAFPADCLHSSHCYESFDGFVARDTQIFQHMAEFIDSKDDSTVSRRSEPSSRAALIGEQTNPWDLLQPQDAASRHRGAKPCRRCGRSGKISLLSPG